MMQSLSNMLRIQNNYEQCSVCVSVKLNTPPFSTIFSLFSPTTTVKNMFERLSFRIRTEFGLRPSQYNIVLYSVYFNGVNIPNDINSIMPISERYGLKPNIRQNIPFHIHIIRQVDTNNSNTFINADTNVNTDADENLPISCPVCLEEQTQNNMFLTQYRCCHLICASCYRQCVQSTRGFNRRCPLCRQPEII